jgi:hypothetical protein
MTVTTGRDPAPSAAVPALRWWRDTSVTNGRLGAIAILLAATGLVLSACGGDPVSPHVASLGTTTTVETTVRPNDGDTPTTTAAKGNDPTGLLDEWANCMRSNGDPDQADPTIDPYGVINISIGREAAQTVSGQVHGGVGPCSNYLAAAQSALRAANPVSPPPDQVELVKYVDCMRANGVPNYPYPTGNTTNFNGTGVDPTSPFVMSASTLCGKQLGLAGWWIAGNGPPGDVVVSSGGPNGGPPTPNISAAVNDGSGAPEIPVTPDD